MLKGLLPFYSWRKSQSGHSYSVLAPGKWKAVVLSQETSVVGWAPLLTSPGIHFSESFPCEHWRHRTARRLTAIEQYSNDCGYTSIRRFHLAASLTWCVSHDHKAHEQVWPCSWFVMFLWQALRGRRPAFPGSAGHCLIKLLLLFFRPQFSR